jgi:hypothetical protein
MQYCGHRSPCSGTQKSSSLPSQMSRTKGSQGVHGSTHQSCQGHCTSVKSFFLFPKVISAARVLTIWPVGEKIGDPLSYNVSGRCGEGPTYPTLLVQGYFCWGCTPVWPRGRRFLEISIPQYPGAQSKVLPELPGLLTKISCPEIYDAFTNKRADIFRKVKWIFIHLSTLIRTAMHWFFKSCSLNPKDRWVF